MTIPRHIIDCAVVKDPEDPKSFRMKYIDYGGGGVKKARFTDAGMYPYFFIRKVDRWVLDGHYNEIVSVDDNGEYRTFVGEEAIKVEMVGPRQVGKFRRKLESKYHIETMESDIVFTRRWMIDKGIRHPLLKRKLYFDIEVDTRHGFCSYENPVNRILSISAVGSDGKEYFFCNKNEIEMIRSFFDLIMKKYEVLSGWNICGGGGGAYGNGFDVPYLISRARYLKMKHWFIPIQEIDAYRAYLTFYGGKKLAESNTLDAVAMQVLGVGKKGKYNARKAWDSLMSDPHHEWLYEYNMQDARLVKLLDEELHILDPYLVAVTDIPVFARDMNKMSIVWEALIMDRCKDTVPRLVLPRKRRAFGGEVQGAITLEPIGGLHKDVLVLDYAGLYVAVMQTIMISPEMVMAFIDWYEQEYGIEKEKMYGLSFVNDAVIREYVEFVRRGEKKPLLSEMLDIYSEKRLEYKRLRKQYSVSSFEYNYYDAMQKFIKTLLVSSYGVQVIRSKGGSSVSRFHNPLMANMITYVGRRVQEWTVNYFESMGFKVVYGDTDSSFICSEKYDSFDLGTIAYDIAKECTEELKKWLVSVFGDINDGYLYIKPEKIFSKLVFGVEQQKKRYIGIVVWTEDEDFCEPFYYVAGVEQKRSDSFQLLKEVENNITRMLLSDDPSKYDDIERYIRNLREELYTGRYDDKLVIEKGMSKPPFEYSDGHILRRVSMQLLEVGGYRPGERVKWVVVNDGGCMKDVRAIFPGQGVEDIEITRGGYNYYWDRIMKLVGKWVPEKYEQQSLEVYY